MVETSSTVLVLTERQYNCWGMIITSKMELVWYKGNFSDISEKGSG